MCTKADSSFFEGFFSFFGVFNISTEHDVCLLTVGYVSSLALCRFRKTCRIPLNIHHLCYHVAVKWTFVYLLEFLKWELVDLSYIRITIRIKTWILKACCVCVMVCIKYLLWSHVGFKIYWNKLEINFCTPLYSDLMLMQENNR